MLYNPYGSGSKPENVFCLKADYVESSHANNTGMAKFINDCVYDTKTPMQLADSDCRTTINGFPIEVYMNGEYLGVYNFNHDRYSYKSYGYDYNKYPNMLVYEINSNSNTSAGAFYRYGDNAESSANVSELEYYKRDFNLIYGNRTADSDTYSEIKTLVEWVSVAEQDLFREMISEHFNKEYLFRYFLTVLMIGAVDSLGKNMKIMTVDGQVWYPTFYDIDTCLGLDNSGYLLIEPDVEIESGSYNTSNSNLWSKVWNYFNAELKEEWAKMRQGSFTLDNLMNYIYGEQISKIPPKLYNDDAQVKYLDFGSLYTYCCHGSKEHQIRRWLRERIAYVDSMLGYFTSQEDQVTIRMNKTGSVSFDVTPYIPLYFSVKWSNATGGTQTFKLKRGETKRFYYTSTTSTDQEVIIYHAKYIKRLDNLSNLNPSSCILSNAVKLTNVEIHSSELYNINVTNNKFLRSINLENCTALGTVTATGSSLNLSNCKYLRYCNVYNTNLTEVQLNTSGGSLTEIYYPKSIQSINLVRQRLLELVGLPYGVGGSEIPTSLYTISIQECPNIKKLNTSSNEAIASSFASMVYVNNLTIRNSLDLASLNFDGFHRLQNVIIENMYNLEEIGFNNLLPVGETSTIKYIGMSNCPKLGTIELNCTSNDYEITFADDAILNFGGLFKLNSITSNCVLKGIKTIIVPINLESMFFTNEYGSGYSTIENIWVSSQCNVDTQATTPIVTHVDSTYSGIDFLGMNLKNIDLGALVNIPKAINFKLSPTTVNPNFNLNRDGETYKYLQPVGTLDLSNYTESLAKFFDGVDLDKLEIICNNNLPQTDLSYCFYNSTFSTNDAINKLLTKVSSITNLDYCFYRTTINSVDILDEINMGASSSMNYTFAECPNIKTLNNVVIPSTVTSVEGMFNKCPLTTITNMIVNVIGSISGLFKGCNRLTTINTLRIPNVTDVSNTFDGCTSLSSLSGFELPSSCTNVSNLFNGCYMLTKLGMEFGANITAGDNWYPPNLETLHDTIISNDYVKLTNCTTLKTLNGVNISGGDLSDLFNGCTNLTNLNGCTFNATTSLARAFKGCSKITINPITTIVDTVTDISEIYSGCTGITDISGSTFGSGITNATNWKPPGLTTANNVTIKNNVVKFTDCTNLTTCNNLDVSNISDLSNFFSNCTSLTSDIIIPNNITNCSNAFSACTGMTRIHANWNNSYTNGITSTDCYAGCTGIEYIDGESVILYPGDNSLDYIPKEWGGYGLVGEHTTVLEINIPRDNYELRLCIYGHGFIYSSSKSGGYYSENNTIAWGDGNYLTKSDILNDPNYDSAKGGIKRNLANGFPTHTYSKAGTYYVKGNFTAGGYGYTSGARECITRFLNLAYKGDTGRYIDNYNGEFNYCINLTYVNLASIKNNPLKNVGSLFNHCSSLTLDNIVGLNELNLSKVTDMSSMFEYCSNITQLPFTTIPNTVTNINGIFKDSGITDISGLTIGSGVTDATDWIKNCPITTANNITMKNDNTKFTGCGTLVSCTNFKITSNVTQLSQVFKDCPKLTSFSFSDESDFSNLTKLDFTFDGASSLVSLNLSNVVCTSKLTAIDGLCRDCVGLTSLYLPSNLQDSSIKTVYQLASNAEKLKTIYNLYLPDGFVEFGNFAFGWVGTIEAKDAIDVIGFRVPNTTNPATVFANVYKMFKSFSNVIWPATTTSIAGMFQGLIHLTHDLEIPSHVTNCSNAFKGCTSMTHIHSNWNNSYTNGITSTDCYAGCTGITHIDDENVITFEGKEGLDEIPEAWGGYEFSVSDTAMVAIEITDKLTFTLTASGSDDTNYLKTSWGDGTSDSSKTAHTYSSAGTYMVKIKYTASAISNSKVLFGYYTHNTNATLRDAGVKVLQVPIGTALTNDHFREWVKLKTVNLDRAILKKPNNCFFGDSVLERLDMTNCTITRIGDNFWVNCSMLTTINISGSVISTAAGLFNGASSVTTILGFDTADFSNNADIDIMFRNCKALTSVPPIRTLLKPGAKPWSINQMFLNCLKLTSIDISGIDFSGVSIAEDAFRYCESLTNIIGLSGANFNSVVTMKNMLGGTTKLAIPIDLSNFARTPINMMGAFSGCGATSITGLDGMVLSANIHEQVFYKTCNLTSLDISGLDTSKAQYVGQIVAKCDNLETLDISNFNTQGVNNSNNKSLNYFCCDMPKLKRVVSKNANVSNMTRGYGMFINCPELTDLDLESWDVSNFTSYNRFLENSTKLTNFKSFKNINANIDFSKCTSLTVTSLLSILNALKSTSTTKTLTLGSVNKAKLSAAQIRIATNKGWTVS